MFLSRRVATKHRSSLARRVDIGLPRPDAVDSEEPPHGTWTLPRRSRTGRAGSNHRGEQALERPVSIRGCVLTRAVVNSSEAHTRLQYSDGRAHLRPLCICVTIVQPFVFLHHAAFVRPRAKTELGWQTTACIAFAVTALWCCRARIVDVRCGAGSF